MKKILLSILLMLSSLWAYDTEIKLTGEYAKELGNPFRVLLEKKDKTISINSLNKKVELVVESNLKKDIYNMTQHMHPDKYILDNASVKNIVRQYYGEEFKVVESKNADVEVNILNGKVILDYANFDEQQMVHHLNKIEVELTVQVIKNGIPVVQKIKMDDKLGKVGRNYDFSIDSKSVTLNIKMLSTKIQNIIEYQLYEQLLK